MGHRLDREVERNFVDAKAKGLEGTDITDYINDNVLMSNVLKTTMDDFDGGYVVCGLTGSGEMFSLRDPWGIRPAFYYKNDEIVALASERPVLQTTFDLEVEDIKELQPGYAMFVKRNGEFSVERCLISVAILLALLSESISAVVVIVTYMMSESFLVNSFVNLCLKPLTATFSTPCSRSFPTQQRWPSMAC